MKDIINLNIVNCEYDIILFRTSYKYIIILKNKNRKKKHSNLVEKKRNVKLEKSLFPNRQSVKVRPVGQGYNEIATSTSTNHVDDLSRYY